MEPTEQEPKKKKFNNDRTRSFRFREDQAEFVTEQEKIHGGHTNAMRAIIDLAMQGGKQTTDQEVVKEYKILLKKTEALERRNQQVEHMMSTLEVENKKLKSMIPQKPIEKTNTPNPPAPVEKKKNWIDEIW